MVSGWTVSQRGGVGLRLFAVACCALWWLASTAFAHEIRPAVVDMLLQADASYRIDIRLNLEAMLAGIGSAHKDSDDSANAGVYNRLRTLQPQEMEREFAPFREEFLQALTLRADGERLRPMVEDVSVAAVGDLKRARDSVIQLSGRLPAGAKTLSWQWDERFGAVVVRVDAAEVGELYTAYLQPGSASEPITLRGVAAQSPWAVLVNYIAVGFEHIVPKGADHILFVVGLFLLSPNWRVLLWQVTAFTVAHTITLAFSMLGWVQLPASIVEPLIAASIVYVCVENLFHERLTRWRPLVVFGFGLLHGLGFASVLTDIGLSPGHFVAGLVGFNLGVELGQLTVLTICFLLVGFWFQHRDWYRRLVAIPASLVIAIIGSYWFVERTLLA